MADRKTKRCACCVDCKCVYECCSGMSAEKVCQAKLIDEENGVYICDKCKLLFSDKAGGLKKFYQELEKDYADFTNQYGGFLRPPYICNEIKDGCPLDAMRQFNIYSIPADEVDRGDETFSRKDRRQNIYQCHQAIGIIYEIVASWHKKE